MNEFPALEAFLKTNSQAIADERERRAYEIENAIFWLEVGGYTAKQGQTMEELWLVTHPLGGQMLIDRWHLMTLAVMQEKKYNEV